MTGVVELCERPGCTRPRKYRTLCGTHYERMRRTGSFDLLPRPPQVGRRGPRPDLRMSIEDRVARHVEWVGECLHWTGQINKDGYGTMPIDRKRRAVHLVVCELVGRPCPPGLVADHECHTLDESCPGGSTCLHRRCVNPDHIRFVDRATNALLGRGPSMVAYRAGTCQRGHVRTPENTYWAPKTGKPQCRDCARELQRKRRAADRTR